MQISRLQTLTARIERLSELVGRVVAWLTLGTVVLTFAVVILRYVFQTGSIALQESVTYLHAAVFMLAAAYTLKHDGHVRVDIFYRKMSPQAKAWVDLTGTLLFLLPVCLFILISSWDYVAVSWSMHEGSREAGGLDAVFLLKALIPLMAVLLLLQGGAQVLRSAQLLAGNRQVVNEKQGLDREL